MNPTMHKQTNDRPQGGSRSSVTEGQKKTQEIDALIEQLAQGETISLSDTKDNIYSLKHNHLTLRMLNTSVKELLLNEFSASYGRQARKSNMNPDLQ